MAAKLAKSVLANKKGVALQFRQLWRHKYVKGNFDASKAWKLFYWPLGQSGAGGKGFNPNTRKAASKLLVSAFNKWAKADMKAKVKRADGVKELPVGQISREEFVRWFTGGGASTSESMLDDFVDEASGTKKKEKPPKERDIQKEMERVEKEGYSLKDVQTYYDMQIAQGLDQGSAINRTKKQFKLKRITVSPAGVVLAPDAPNPKPTPAQQFVQEPPPEEPPPEEPPPEEPPPKAAPKGRQPASTMKGGTFPEGPKGPEAAPKPK
jgi:hypothetical protein